jgi:energy-coupling factor transporter ATP-binding protein EcfA2
MTIRKLRLEHVGPIKKAEIEFGDLTVLVGPQASGKSIFLQCLKLLVDSGSIFDTLQRYGFDWDTPREFLEIYFGEGMGAGWKLAQLKLVVDGERRFLRELVAPAQKVQDSFFHPESLFCIPAHRVLTLGRGWPRPFSDYSFGDPFVVRDFSEKLRVLLETELGRDPDVFPRDRRLKAEIRPLLQRDVFGGFRLQIDKLGAQKRLVLQDSDAGSPLPFMVWSAGQREFVPLLLGLYWLLPATKPQREGLTWAVIEEPEMGLHPRAISVVLLIVLDLLARGYRVCLSTHSPHVLDLVWALGILQERKAKPERLLELFDVQATPGLRKVAKAAMGKRAKVYFFDRQTGVARDISSLDPGASDSVVSGWGGLSEFSGRAADVVASVVSETE